MGFRVDQPHRPTVFRVAVPLAVVVVSDSLIEIVGDAGVKRVVAAADDVEVP